MFYNLRRPIAIDYLGDVMDKDQRATLLSVEALIRSILVIIFAPLFGFIAEVFSIGTLFLWLAIIIIIFNFLLLKGHQHIEKAKDK